MRFLIVDDSKTMRLIVRRALRQAGYENITADEAANGVDALRMVGAEKYDLILSDWNMDQMNGPDMLKALKDQGNPVKVGFVTSEGSAEMVQKVLQMGALFLLPKPFTPEDLKAAVDRALHR